MKRRGLEDAPGRASILSAPLLLVAGAALASMFGFQTLLSVVPLYADRVGSGSAGAGLATAAFMLSTVLTQAQMPWLLGLFGYRAALGFGTALLGLPAFLYSFSGTLGAVLAVTLLRGVGFGFVTVVFAALIADLTPPGRRGEALGIYGIAITLPTIFCNALGLWLAQNAGFWAVFSLGGAAPLLGLLLAALLRSLPNTSGESAGFFAGLVRGPLLRVALLFCSATFASGLVLTFLPLAKPGSGLFSATGALLVFGLSVTVFRWLAGRFSDRRKGGSAALLLPGLVASAVGITALSGGGFVLIFGAISFGAGFGLLQNSTLLLMMDRVGAGEASLASALWNAAFDAGTGLGAVLFGFIIFASGFAAAFYLCAALLLVATLIVPLDRRFSSSGIR